MNGPRTLALILAAGSGQRAGSAAPKLHRPLNGLKNALQRSLDMFCSHPAVSCVRVVSALGGPSEAVVEAYGLESLIPGGATRQDSARLGLEASPGFDRVLIHDAARPFVTHAVIDRVLAALDTHDGALPALPVTDSLRRGSDIVEDEVDRTDLWRVQTPQGFRFDAILAAHRDAPPGATDDAEVLRAAGGTVAIVEGDEVNFKLTTPADFVRADQMLAAAMISRAASGYDVHRFGPGDHIWLCGVQVPHSHGLIGHSDADAGLHAVTDALLGCISAGDIGEHFPPSDPKWRGASSDRFLTHARDLILACGGVIDHVDVTLICERPKVGPHRDAMRQRIAELLDISIEAVSIKATTTEGLGFAGRGEGLAAQAMATVRTAR